MPPRRRTPDSSRRHRAAHGDGGDITATKLCPRCGLAFSNRKKWASRGLWPSIVYCSERCRRAAAAPPRGAGR